MKIYTKTGDGGQTGLFGGGRVAKDSLRIEAYGTVDELNSVLGILQTESSDQKTGEIINFLQNQLFNVGSDLATPLDYVSTHFTIPRIGNEQIETAEKMIDNLESLLEPLQNFILPGGSKAAAYTHLARTVCRRAERRIVTLSEAEDINHKIIIFVNRVSDLLFVLARYLNKLEAKADTPWKK
ncbi:MAG: cob(I)yrinic acid a,c-diamide adenosyltransferase [Ignavibacteriaceae bacterium]|nr:cob(I)yrinic acid a,c-diamide adenosyltransferase [Ignavibacteriaceae bacterium]